jgi:hypothetical protein
MLVAATLKRWLGVVRPSLEADGPGVRKPNTRHQHRLCRVGTIDHQSVSCFEGRMYEEMWTYKTRQFSFFCEAREPGFIDPFVHGPEVIRAVKRGSAMVLHLSASVYFRSVLVGEASKIDCVYVSAPLPEDDKYRPMFASF